MRSPMLRALLIVTFMILVSVTCTFPAFANEPVIRWEIENRFRDFKNSDFLEIAKVYNPLKTPANPQPSALQLERALENQIDQADKSFNKISGTNPDSIYGWASTIYENTCGRHKYSNCKMENGDKYLEPVTATIFLYADGIVAETCEWFIDEKPLDTNPSQCNTRVEANIKYEGHHHVEVRPNTGSPPPPQDITLKDILILSFGDSYSAGEGNPDKPVNLRDDTFNDYKNSSGGKPFPIREDLNNVSNSGDQFFEDLAADWTNTQCHRSLYSQHTKAALQYALEHPHLSVTFLNYSCTGAEVYEGILNAWWARDDLRPEYYDDAPQLVKALRDLCKDSSAYAETKWATSRRDEDYNNKSASFPECTSFVRKPIDALLLSIGGNDVGFANIVANVAVASSGFTGSLSGARNWVYGLWREAAHPQTIKAGLNKAKEYIALRYKELGSSFYTYLQHLAPDKVILSAYPNVIFDENGKLCKGGKSATIGMDVHDILGIYDPKAPADTSRFITQFHQIMKKAAEEDLHWLFADEYVARTGAPNNFEEDADGIGHGICAAGPNDAAGGIMRFPRPTKLTPRYVWKPFYPHEWRPYSRRNRWLVTPNDAFLTTNYHDAHTVLVDDPIQPLFAATLSGSFHPNPLGHAAMADSVLIKLREALRAYED